MQKSRIILYTACSPFVFVFHSFVVLQSLLCLSNSCEHNLRFECSSYSERSYSKANWHENTDKTADSETSSTNWAI